MNVNGTIQILSKATIENLQKERLTNDVRY